MRSPVAMLALLLAACSSSPSAPLTPTLTVKGGTATAAARSARVGVSANVPPGTLTGDPSSISIGVYAMWISANADCSNPELVQDYGTTVQVKDFLQQPTLFTGSPTIARASCIALKISDVIRFQPATSFGGCVAATTYSIDIYRSDNTDSTNQWKDVNLANITASGTDSLPSDDRVTLIMTRDTTAAQARGFSTNQTLPLGADLVIPGQGTFVWGGAGTATSYNGICGLEPGQPSFQ